MKFTGILSQVFYEGICPVSYLMATGADVQARLKALPSAAEMKEKVPQKSSVMEYR